LIADSTITVMPSWEKKQTLAFSSLQKSLYGVAPGAQVKLSDRDLPPLPKPTDLDLCGQLNLLTPARFQTATCKKPTPITKSSKLSFSVSTSDDPIIARIADQIREEGGEKTTIFATDNIVAALMTAPRSVLPWGISVVREGKFIYLDATESSLVNLLSVCETSGTSGTAGMDSQDSESVNSPSNLWREATYVSDMYAQHVVNAASGKPAVEFEHPCPFLTEDDKAEGKEAAPVAYRYRRYPLSDTVDIVVRCELQAVQTPCTAETIDGNLVAVCTLNEWNPSSTKWSVEVDKHIGFVLASELRNNACRMARVMAKAILAGANMVHVGFVTRKSASVNTNHVILSTVSYDTQNFARQLNVTERMLWGVADNIFKMIVPLPEGKYLITKQDVSPVITVYSTPFEEETATA